MPSIRDVAEQAGVSVATVSLVLNDKGNISPETRQRVLDVVAELGYIRSARARSLRAAKWRCSQPAETGLTCMYSWLSGSGTTSKVDW